MAQSILKKAFDYNDIYKNQKKTYTRKELMDLNSLNPHILWITCNSVIDKTTFKLFLKINYKNKI